MRIIKTLDGLHGVQVTVLFEPEWGEYQVRIKGSPDATYHTDGRKDAIDTAEVMRADAEINPRCRPTACRNQKPNDHEYLPNHPSRLSPSGKFRWRTRK